MNALSVWNLKKIWEDFKMIEYKNDINDFWGLFDLCWSGAVDRLREIADLGIGDEFMQYLEDCFCGYTPTLTEINDFIWFECDDWIEEHKNNDDDDNEE